MLKNPLFLSLIIIAISVPVRAGTLHLVTSLDPIEAGEYIEQFRKDTGIDTQWIRLSAGEVVARIRAEGERQTQDVWFGGPVPDFVAAKEAGVLKPYSPKGCDEIPQKWRDAENYFTPIYLGSIAFVSNENYLRENNLSPPKSWQDLLDRQWKGRVTMAYPYTAGTGYTILAGLITLMGEEGAFSYWKELDPMVHHYTKSGGSPIIDVGLGESSVGIVFDQDAVRKGVSRGFPLIVTYPKEGTPFEVGAVALLKNGPATEVEMGKKFIDWIVSLRAQDLFHKYGRTPIHPKAKIPEDMGKEGEIKLIQMDMVEMGRLKPRYVERWRRELKQ